MHAGFPQVTPALWHTLNAGMQGDDELKGLLANSGGHLVAEGLALALRLGFGLIVSRGLLDADQSRSARAFFADNFEITDPLAPGGMRYYQGRFLIRTRRAGDDMNVLLAFCPDPEKLYLAKPWGQSLDSFAVVQTRVMDEDEADSLERKVDLVIRFKDAEALLGLIGQPNVDIVGLLLQNLVQLTGNVGHLFKLGAIGADVQRLMTTCVH
jgi:hypothetical protein